MRTVFIRNSNNMYRVIGVEELLVYSQHLFRESICPFDEDVPGKELAQEEVEASVRVCC